MSHKRVKAIAADEDLLDDYDDEFYGEEEQEGPTAEDKERLRLGTIEVRKALGPEYTDKDIQDSLWYYYYDVGKTITYLKSKCSTGGPY